MVQQRRLQYQSLNKMSISRLAKHTSQCWDSYISEELSVTPGLHKTLSEIYEVDTTCGSVTLNYNGNSNDWTIVDNN